MHLRALLESKKPWKSHPVAMLKRRGSRLVHIPPGLAVEITGKASFAVIDTLELQLALQDMRVPYGDIRRIVKVYKPKPEMGIKKGFYATLAPDAHGTARLLMRLRQRYLDEGAEDTSMSSKERLLAMAQRAVQNQRPLLAEDDTPYADVFDLMEAAISASDQQRVDALVQAFRKDKRLMHAVNKVYGDPDSAISKPKKGVPSVREIEDSLIAGFKQNPVLSALVFSSMGARTALLVKKAGWAMGLAPLAIGLPLGVITGALLKRRYDKKQALRKLAVAVLEAGADTRRLVHKMQQRDEDPTTPQNLARLKRALAESTFAESISTAL